MRKIEGSHLLGVVLLLEVLLGIRPEADRLTWALENAPVWIGLVACVWTYRSFPLTRLCYLLLSFHAVILMIGGYYTYAKVPLFDWIRDSFHLSRNHYDRVGHFAQGFFPAILVRELLLRTSTLRPGKWLFFLCVCVCLAFSAFYEIIEWRVAVMSGEEASTAFLATQGDVWDTQWDMFLAVVGAITSLLVLSKAHDRSLARLRASDTRPA